MNAKSKRKQISTEEWFYLGMLCGGMVAALWASLVIYPVGTRDGHSTKALELPGVVPWHALDKVSYVQRDGKTEIEFDEGINRINGTSIKLRGYITPLQLGRNQTHFILSPAPPSCAFHLAPGAAQMVEVFSSAPVAYSLEPIVISGTLALQSKDPAGVYYHMADAVQIFSERM